LINPKKSEFNLKNNAKDLDTSLFTNLLAQVYKRMSIYRNHRVSVFMEFIFPCLFLGASTCMKFAFVWFNRTPAEEMNATSAPENSPLLFSPYIMNNWTSNVEPQQFIYNWSEKERF
jgi:hypothetical protein